MNKREMAAKRLEYCVENKCDICQQEEGSGFPWIDGRCYGFTERLYDAIALLQEPIEARLHLCESCKKHFPDCEATKEGIVFGNGIGNDNIIGCFAYDNRWMSQNEPRVLALDEIHGEMTVWLEDVDKADVILAITESEFYALHGLVRCFITSDNRRIAPPKREYGIRWRAWTSEPTDEQRKAVKWND